MPKAGIKARIQQMTTLRRLSHAMFTSEEIGELIEAAAGELQEAAYDSNEASLIRYLRRSYAEARQLPPEFVRRMSEVSGKAHPAWVEARENDDCGHLRPHVEQVVALVQEMAELYGYEDEKYEAEGQKLYRRHAIAENGWFQRGQRHDPFASKVFFHRL